MQETVENGIYTPRHGRPLAVIGDIPSAFLRRREIQQIKFSRGGGGELLLGIEWSAIEEIYFLQQTSKFINFKGKDIQNHINFKLLSRKTN